jgi:hypothetical protein
MNKSRGFIGSIVAAQRSLRIGFFMALAALSGCEKPVAPSDAVATPTAPPLSTPTDGRARREWGPAHFDVCALITREEVEAIQQTSVANTRAVGGADAGLLISQCFYLGTSSAPVLAVSVSKSDPQHSPQQDVKEYWERNFSSDAAGGGKSDEAEEARRERAEKNAAPPRPIEGLAQEANWFKGTLSVLANDALLRISPIGDADEETRLERAKALAVKALARF